MALDINNGRIVIFWNAMDFRFLPIRSQLYTMSSSANIMELTVHLSFSCQSRVRQRKCF